MMHRAIEAAREAGRRSEVPVGAVVYTAEGTLLATAGNRVIEKQDPTAHAEIEAIRAACRVKQDIYLQDCILAVTLEPCAMCAQAIAHARLKELRFGAYDTKSGGTLNGARVFNSPTCHHKPTIIDGIEEETCKSLLQQFFKERR